MLLGYFSLLSFANAQQIVRERIFKIGNSGRSFGASTTTREGNIVFTGGNGTTSGTQSIIALLNPNVDTIWLKQGPLISIGLGIKQTSNSGYMYYATKRYTAPTASGTILQYYDSNGQLQWTMPYAMNAFDTGHLLLTAPDSGYFLGGKNIINGKNRRFTLGRTDSLGNLKWRKGYDWGNSDFFSDMQHTRNGNIVMYGVTITGMDPQRLKLLLVNQNGDSVLGRKLTIVGNPNRNERMTAGFCGVTPLSDGGFLLAAEIDTTATNAPSKLGMVVKANASLQPVWHYIERSVPNNVVFTRSRELTDGSVIMLAYERKGTTSAPGNKFFLYRFSAAGALLNIYPFTSSLAVEVEGHAMEALSDSSFMIGGSATITPAPNSTYGFYVAKVKVAGLPPALPLPAPIINGIQQELSTSKGSLGQSYPNPTATEAIIPYSLPKNYRKASISIRELATGREIRSYTLKKGSNSLKADVSSLSNGLYLYTLVVDEKPIATKKLAVMR